MKKTRTLLTLALCLLLACGVAGGAFSAFAAYQTNNLSPEGLLYNGVLNEMSWKSTGGAESKIKAKQENSYYNAVHTGTNDCYIQPHTKLNLDNGDVRFTIEVLSIGGASSTCALAPTIGTSLKSFDGTGGLVRLANGGITPPDMTGLEWYSDETLETPIANVASWGYAADMFGLFSTTAGGKITFEYRKTDGVLGIINEGTFNGSPYFQRAYIKNALSSGAISGDLYFGGIFYSLTDVFVDNMKLEQKDSSGNWVEKDSTDCEGAWNSANATAQAGKWFVEGGKKIIGAKLDMENPSDTDRLVLRDKITVDEKCDRVFVLSGSVKFTTLTKNFGILMGTEEETSAISSGSYVYFHNVAGESATTTHITLGETDYDLEVDLADDSFHALTVETFTKDTTVTVTVDGVKKSFTDAKLAGYLAFVASGDGDATVSFEPNLSVVTYAYRGSEGGAQATNFNTGFIDEDKWTIQNVTAISGVNDPREVVGIEVTDDGRLYFHGVGNYCYFSSVQRYADYVLEVDYITPAAYPAVTGNAGNPQQGCVCLGANEHSAYVNSHMFNMWYYPTLSATYMVYENKKDNTEPQRELSSSYQFGKDNKEGVFAMKFVVLNNTITVYVQDITENEFNAANYTKLMEVEVADTYGYVSLLSADPGFAKFDNVRITPLDDPDAEKRAEKLAAFVDRVAIEDEYITLATPEVSADGTTVSWNNVKYAEGYIVTVNGESQRRSLNNFTVTGDPGDYKITVQAVSSKGYATDSAQSAEITVTIAAPSSGNQGGDNQGNGDGDGNGTTTEKPEEKGCGCSGSAAAAGTLALAFAVLALAAGVTLIRRKIANK